MSLYFGTTEITNIDNLVPQSGLDITDIWFGSTNVYTVWQTYEGALPATINANGDDMRQYQIYGATGGVGDRTENLFDYTQLVDGYTYDNNGQMILNPDVTSRFYYAAIPFIQVTPGATYVRTYNLTPLGNTVNYYDGEKNFITKATPGTGIPFTVPNNCNFITFIVDVKSYDRKKYMLTEGSTPPASYEPYGYKLDMSVKSGNLFDYREYVNGYYITSSGVETKASQYLQYITTWLNHSGHINIWPDKSYTISAHHQNMNNQQTVAIAWYDKNKIFISRISTVIPQKNAGTYSFTATAPQNAKFAIFNFFTDDVQKVMFTPGTTPPDEYQPYSNTVTPIFIGDEPLEEDEYVDFGGQKVYRMIDGTLTPTDPPVTLPALPTCEGTTVIDYAGQSVAPEKVLLKYRKEGF